MGEILDMRPSTETVRPSLARSAEAGLTDRGARLDQGGLAEAYAQHSGPVHALARALCGQQQAEDITREIFLRLRDSPDRFSADARSLRDLLLMETLGRAVEVPRCDDSPPLTDLPDQERDAIALASVGGLTYREVAALLAVTESVVKSRMRTGLVRLRASLVSRPG